MQLEKLAFITTDSLFRLNSLPANEMGKWGKMNGQQMVEHLTAFFKISTGNIYIPLVTPEENLPRLKQFLYSDKEFRENTKAPVLPEEPLPLGNTTITEALQELANEIVLFNNRYIENPQQIVQHPVFGDLSYEEWVLLHYKHVLHHLKQFELL